MKIFFYKILIFLFIIYLSLSVHADKANVIFSVEDPGGDECGPCYYNYPQDKVFKPYKGLFDIRNFSIIDNNENYIFEFDFTEITDPWESRFGFSMPLLELYIDNKEGGCTDLFKDGANVRLDPDYPWDKLIKISGWWVRVFTPEDRNKNMIALSANAEEFPQNIENCKVEVKDNKIRVELEKELTGDLSVANIYILIGSFDPFGFDHFRGIREEESSWYFSSGNDININYAPRVIDIILPQGRDQGKVLGKFEEDYCQIYPVKIKSSFQGVRITKNNIVYLGLILIFIIIVIINKENIFKHGNFKNMKTG